MAPVTSSPRLSAALAGFLASRDPKPQSQGAASSPIAAITRRFHSLPRFPSLATRTPLEPPSRALEARQEATTATIPGAYPGVNAGPDPGTVVGVTLGSVAAFLLLLWIAYTCLSMGNRNTAVTDTVSSYGTASVVTRKSRRRHSHQSHHRSPSRRETVEIRTSRVMPMPMPMPDPPAPPPAERVVMEETIRRSTPVAPPAGPPPPRMAPRMVHSDDDDDDDEEVVVIEEHTPPRRHKSRSHKRRSSSVRRESGFREVEPDRFAGGDTPLRDVRRTSRHAR